MPQPERRLNVLVVDDDPPMAERVQMMLQGPYDVEVRYAPDGEPGLAAALDEPPDLIFVDLIMLEMNADAFAERVRNEPDLRDIPLILLERSGPAFVRTLLEGRDTLFAGFITLPCTTEQFRETVADALEHGNRFPAPQAGVE